MAADGHLNFDTRIDESGFSDGINKLNGLAKSGIATIGKALAGVTAALGAGAVAGVKYNATIEQYQTSFEVMTGSAEKAAEIVQELTKIGAETPFEMTGLAETTQLLMNYGFTADDAMDKMMMLGDISQGSADKMNRIATAYGQMSSAGKVQLEDVKQMIEAGFNPLQEISQSTGESMESLYDRISKGTISVDEITASMERSTSAGGKYFQSMEKQSQTVSGQLSTLSDNVQQLLGGLTSGLSEVLGEDILPAVNDMLGRLNDAFASGGFQGFLDELGNAVPMIQGVTDAVSGLVGILQGMSTEELENLGKIAVTVGAAVPALSLFSGGISGVATATQAFNGISDGIISGIGKLPKSFQSAGKSASGLIKDFGNLGNSLALPFQDLGKKIAPSVSQTLEAMASMWDSGPGGKITKSVSGLVSRIGTSFGKIGPAISSKFPGITSKVGELASVFSKIGGNIGGALGKVAETVSTYGGIIGESFTPILKKAAGFAPQFLKFMNVAGGIGIVVAGLGLLYNAFGGEIDQILLMVQTKGPQVITNLCNGITAALPNLIAQGAMLLNNLMLAITANLPAIVSGGISIVSSLVSGIAAQLPTLIPTAAEMVLTLVSSLLSGGSIGQVVDAGLELLSGVVEGILNAIPKLIAAAPTIIGNLVEAIVSNLPKIVQTGIQLIGKLASGLIQAIPDLLASIPEIISSIIDAFTSVDWGEVGMNIIKGIASGISGAVGSLIDAAASAAESALNWVKDKLGIHSPSKVFRDQVGKMMALGMGIGFEKNIPVKSMTVGLEKAVKSLKKDVVFTTSARSDKSVGAIKRNPQYDPDNSFDYDRFERIQRKVAKEQSNRPIYLGTDRIDKPLPKGAVPQLT